MCVYKHLIASSQQSKAPLLVEIMSWSINWTKQRQTLWIFHVDQPTARALTWPHCISMCVFLSLSVSFWGGGEMVTALVVTTSMMMVMMAPPWTPSRMMVSVMARGEGREDW